jgi:hypothetical protein
MFEDEKNISLPNLREGMYFLVLRNKEKKIIQIEKIIK